MGREWRRTEEGGQHINSCAREDTPEAFRLSHLAQVTAADVGSVWALYCRRQIMVFCGSVHQALQEKFGGEWAPLRALRECYGDASSGRIFVLLTRYCEAVMHHNKHKAFVKRLKRNLVAASSMFGIGQDDILSTTGASSTVVSAKGFLAGMSLQFVARDKKDRNDSEA